MGGVWVGDGRGYGGSKIVENGSSEHICQGLGEALGEPPGVPPESCTCELANVARRAPLLSICCRPASANLPCSSSNSVSDSPESCSIPQGTPRPGDGDGCGALAMRVGFDSISVGGSSLLDSCLAAAETSVSIATGGLLRARVPSRYLESLGS